MKLVKLQNNKFLHYLSDRKNKISVSGVSMKLDWLIVLGVIALVFIILLYSSYNLISSIEADLGENDAERNSQSQIKLKERDMRTVLDDLLDRRNISSVKKVIVPIETSTTTEDIIEN